MDKDNVLLFGLTACALGLSFFILWGPKLGRRSQNNCSLVALQNLGLTCFLNSLLQALASCPSFLEWLSPRKVHGSVSESLYNVLKLLCYERALGIGEEVHSPDSLVRYLSGKTWPTFPQEQDPHELFLHVLTTLEEEELRSTPERAESLLDALEDGELNANRVCSHGDVPVIRKTPSSRIEKSVLTPNPFRGYLASQLSCLSCGSRSTVVYDKFDTLTLALPSKGISFKLQSLLDDYVKAELVEGFSCDHCNKERPPENPPVLSQALKAIKIGKLPKCLCIHISRTYMNNDGFMYKRNNYVDFPEYLMMSHYTHNSSMLKEKKPVKLLSSESTIKFPKGSLSSSVLTSLDSEPTLTKYKSLEATDDSEGTAVSSEEEFVSPLSPKMDLEDPISVMKNNNNTVQAFAAGSSFISGQIYRIKAVVEHRGSADSGHFITYRRGPLQSDIRHRSSDFVDQSESRWFFTSDETVKKSTLCDALQANAYLLFYEKCVSETPPTNNTPN